MKFKETVWLTISRGRYRGCFGTAPLMIVFFFLFVVLGCANGKAGEKTTALTKESFDTSYEPEGPTKRGSDPMPTATQTKEMHEKQIEQASATKTAHVIEQPAELQPILAVMPRSSRILNKEKDSEPKTHLELAFDNADIHEVLDITLFELFKINYMVDPGIRAKVTFHISGDYTKLQFINILNNVLNLNGLAIVKGRGNIFKVIRRSESAGAGVLPLPGEEELTGAGDQTRMIRLRYISSSNAAKNLKPFLSKNAIIVQDTVTNSIMITDTVENLEKAVGILGMMDVEYFSDISWRVFPIEETDAAEMSRDLSKILKIGGLYNRPGVEKGGCEIVPIKTMNALLVVTKWPSMLKLIDEWITAMDHADDSGTNVFVYFVENGTASELADILKQVYGGKSSGSAKKTTIIKPTNKSGPSGELSGKIEIIPDETNNAIVFKASGRDFKIIKEVLKKLDIVPRQVLINVVIAEVTLSGSLEYGVEWFLKDNAHSNYKVQGILDDGTTQRINTALGSGTTGLSIALYDSADFLRGLITALESEGEVNILSSPNILAIDNKESIIEVGEQVPVPTGDSTTDTGTVVRTIQYRDTGVLLKVTPHINSSGMIKLELTQEVSEVGTQDEALEAYSFLTRKAQTSLVIEDGQTIVIGGLMRSKSDTSDSGIPFLRAIPILGYAFGGSSKSINKTELIFLVTPKVISTRTEADIVTRDFSLRVDRIKELIEKKGLK